MWINKKEYEQLLFEQRTQERLLEEQNKKIKELEDDSGEALIGKISALAKKAKLDVYSAEYQNIMHRLFMDVAGRHSNAIKGYSQAAFMKDNSEEILERVRKFQEEASIITKQLEHKGEKK